MNCAAVKLRLKDDTQRDRESAGEKCFHLIN